MKEGNTFKGHYYNLLCRVTSVPEKNVIYLFIFCIILYEIRGFESFKDMLKITYLIYRRKKRKEKWMRQMTCPWSHS